jgi:hypothetical protein
MSSRVDVRATGDLAFRGHIRHMFLYKKDYIYLINL